ncbi:MAG: hypothetical protein J0G94_18700 [Sphingomonadales bacterium]|nr:hypothetical protein [Sphingomonadales bacterium]
MTAGAYQSGSQPPLGAGSQSLIEISWAYVAAHYGRFLFFFVFVLPTAVAILYWGGVATDRYVSETRFIVRSVERPALEGAAAFLQDVGITRANDDAFAIEDFIVSRDMMRALMLRFNLREVYTRPEADWATRYWTIGRDSDEAFYRYFRRQLALTRDLERGITTVQVSAYRQTDAKAIADMILQLSEARVNELNARALDDAVSVAKKNLQDAGANLVAANVALTRYRNESQLVDPAQTAGNIQDRASTLDMELAMLRIQLQGMVRYAPSNPGIPSLKRRIAAVEGQAAAQKSTLTGGDGALTTKLGDFEEFVVKRELAEQLFENAEKEFNAAMLDARRQQIYIEAIARPNIPDDSIEPRRLRNIATTALLSFWTFLILYLLVSGGREHLNLAR